VTFLLYVRGVHRASQTLIHLQITWEPSQQACPARTGLERGLRLCAAPPAPKTVLPFFLPTPLWAADPPPPGSVSTLCKRRKMLDD
jgi:hypothetical protein